MSDFDSGKAWIIRDDSAGGLEVDALAGGSVTGVLDNVLTTILTHTALAKTLVSHISCTGTVYAKFQLFKNAVLIETRRGGPDRTLVFEFNKPLKLESGDILDVKATHYVVGASEEFEATLYGA